MEHVSAIVSGGALFLAGHRRGGALGILMKIGGVALLYRGQQGYRRLYDALGIALPTEPTGVGRWNQRVETSAIVDCPRQEIYRIWRNLQNLPVFMEHLVSVHEIDDERSLWVAAAPAGMVIKWDARIVNDVEDTLIAWTTLEGSGVDHAGFVRFEDAGKGKTKITVAFRYDPPADVIGIAFAKLFRSDPQRQIEKDLRRFKAIMELGQRHPRRHPKPDTAVL